MIHPGCQQQLAWKMTALEQMTVQQLMLKTTALEQSIASH